MSERRQAKDDRMIGNQMQLRGLKTKGQLGEQAGSDTRLRPRRALFSGRTWGWLCLLLLSGWLVGCQPGENAQQDADSKQTSAAQNDRPAGEDRKPSDPWSGRWMLVVTKQTSDFHPLLIQFEKRAGQMGVMLMDKAPRAEFKDWDILAAEFDEDQTRMLFTTGEVQLMFHGKLYDDVILGSVMTEEFPVPTLARLEKTANSSLRSQETPQDTPGASELDEAVEDPNRVIEKLEKFTEEFANSPLVFKAHEALLAQEVQADKPVERVAEVAQNMLASADRWGDALTLDALFDIVEQINFTPAYRSVTDEYMQKLAERYSPEFPDMLASRYSLYRGKHLLGSDEASEQQEGQKILDELLADKPYDFNAIVALAQFYESQQQLAEALAFYTRLAVLPGVSRIVGNIDDLATGEKTTPLKKTRSLFDGDDAAFEKYLDESYEKEVFSFVGEEDRQEQELRPDRRVPLLELFTGAMCPPCVAGDLALGGIEQIFPAPEAIIVRYHQHIPGPDPLTNAAGESRFSYYGGRGTPALFINGKAWESVGGYVIHADQHYQQLKQHVGSLINQVSLITLQLDAALEGDELVIKAEANPLSKDRKNLKLRLLLVEPLVHYAAPNGIRLHEMVVRDVPGGSGVAAQDGKATQELRVSLPDLQAGLQKEMQTFQEERNYKFDQIPASTNALRVIAFVQDDTSKEILQSTISPVIEWSAAAAETPAAQPADKSDDKSEKKPAEQPAEKTTEPATEKSEEKPATPEAKPEEEKSASPAPPATPSPDEPESP